MSEAAMAPALAAGSAGGRMLAVRNESGLGPMLWIGTYTTLLSIVTLTVFRFWGRTSFRRRLWADTKVGGEPLEYTGRGMELFVGFIIAAVFIMTPILIVLIAAQMLLPPMIAVAAGLAVYLVIFVLAGVAIFMARRYHLSRTRYRGVRFAQTGSPWRFSLAYIGYALLSAVTLGWFGPAGRLRLSRRMWSQAYYGSQPFRFEATPDAMKEPVYLSFAVAWVGTYVAFGAWVFWAFTAGLFAGFESPTPNLEAVGALYLSLAPLVVIIGLASAWHYAVMIRRIVKSLSVGGLKFSSNVGTLSIIWLSVSNLLLIVLTLGFGFMAAQMRLWKRIANSMTVAGDIDFTAVRQSEHDAPKQGEGLADGLDLVSNF